MLPNTVGYRYCRERRPHCAVPCATCESGRPVAVGPPRRVKQYPISPTGNREGKPLQPERLGWCPPALT